MEDSSRVIGKPRMAGRRKLSIVGENRHFTNDPVLSEIAWFRKPSDTILQM